MSMSRLLAVVPAIVLIMAAIAPAGDETDPDGVTSEGARAHRDRTPPPPPPSTGPPPHTPYQADPFAWTLVPQLQRSEERQEDGPADGSIDPPEFNCLEYDPTTLVPTLKFSFLYSDASQGDLALAAADVLGAKVLPMSVDGLDWNTDGAFSETDAMQYMNWINANVSAVACAGPVCIDYEAPWWNTISSPSVGLGFLANIFRKYEEGLVFSQMARPHAEWGYWGLPQLLHLSPDWEEELPVLIPLLQASDVIYPSAYDCIPGNLETNLYHNYTALTMELMEGTHPVYPYVNVRYCGMGGDFTQWVPIEETVANAHAILTAEYVDPSGQIHRPAGIVLWDKYLYPDDVESWAALDAHHVDVLTALAEVVEFHAATTYAP